MIFNIFIKFLKIIFIKHDAVVPIGNAIIYIDYIRVDSSKPWIYQGFREIQSFKVNFF
jgi:hypothetical protein